MKMMKVSAIRWTALEGDVVAAPEVKTVAQGQYKYKLVAILFFQTKQFCLEK